MCNIRTEAHVEGASSRAVAEHRDQQASRATSHLLDESGLQLLPLMGFIH